MAFRYFSCILILLSSLNVLHAEEKSSGDELGRSLILAIRDQDQKAYVACWATTAQMLSFLNNLPDDAPTISPEEMDKFTTYYERVQKEVVESYSALLADMKQKGINPEEIVFKSAKIRYQTEGGIKRVNSYDIIFTFNGVDYWLQQDDAHHIDGKWRFTDSPAKVVLK